MKVLPVTDKAATQKILDGYREHQAKWNDETSKEFDEAKDLEKDVEKAEARARRFDLGEVLLEIGLVITSITLLTRQRAYWFAGLGFSAAGIVAAVLGLLLS
jgi:hypothetical protein